MQIGSIVKIRFESKVIALLHWHAQGTLRFQNQYSKEHRAN